MNKPFPLVKIVSWVISLLVPIALVLGVVRLLLTPVFIRLEYRMPNFPADQFGFTQTERLQWAEIARQYLLNRADSSFLGDLRFADGTAVYNQRELRHMVDVQKVVQGAMQVFDGVWIALLAVGVWAWRKKWMENYLAALARGGWLTVGLLGTVIVLILLSFNAFFVGFHRVFFEGDTWLFLYSDTLIRLFPEKLWQDAFLLVGGLTFGGGLALAYGFRNRKLAR